MSEAIHAIVMDRAHTKHTAAAISASTLHTNPVWRFTVPLKNPEHACIHYFQGCLQVPPLDLTKCRGAVATLQSGMQLCSIGGSVSINP